MVILKVVRSDLNRMRDFHDDKSNSRWLNNDRENKWNSSLWACFVRSNGITKWKERISIMDNRDACTMLHFGEIILCIVHNWWFPSLFLRIDTLKYLLDISMKNCWWWRRYGKQIKCNDTDYSRFHLNCTRKCQLSVVVNFAKWQFKPSQTMK